MWLGALSTDFGKISDDGHPLARAFTSGDFSEITLGLFKCALIWSTWLGAFSTDFGKISDNAH